MNIKVKNPNVLNASIKPKGMLDILSKSEVARLLDTSQSGLYKLFRNCALAVLNCGSQIDDGKQLLDMYRSFNVRLVQQERGIELALTNAPAEAFVDGKMIQGIREHLVAVVRDVLYANDELNMFDTGSSIGTTDAVFHLLRNAQVLEANKDPNMVVCWGGHSISRNEYDYSKDVGYELGLRSLDICTGCGPGAMKGPMKGATIGHAKQRHGEGRYLGISEPGIIAAESPNPIVNNLVIMPDIEKRLEAFVRVGHGILIFPGGAGTMEELLFILGLLLHEENQDQPLPLVLTGPASSAEYFAKIDQFILQTLGEVAQQRYQIIIDDPAEVARTMEQGMQAVRAYRKQTDDAYYFNWRLKIDRQFQQPFIPTHDNMRRLNLKPEQSPAELAAQLRRAFSGIVAGNVKEEGIRAVDEFGPFEITGDPAIMQPIDQLLETFAEQFRMKLPGNEYRRFYQVV